MTGIEEGARGLIATQRVFEVEPRRLAQDDADAQEQRQAQERPHPDPLVPPAGIRPHVVPPPARNSASRPGRGRSPRETPWTRTSDDRCPPASGPAPGPPAAAGS